MIAGFAAGFIAMFPGALIYTALLAFYPAILEESIPANFVLDQLGSPGFQLFFQLVLFGTFIETGTGMIHGFNERVLRLPHRTRPSDDALDAAGDRRASCWSPRSGWPTASA